MKSMMITIPVEPGITLRAIRTDRFKTGCFSINLLQPHRRETASVDALLPSVLLHGTARFRIGWHHSGFIQQIKKTDCAIFKILIG